MVNRPYDQFSGRARVNKKKRASTEELQAKSYSLHREILDILVCPKLK
jgi:hypothetical protein